jgi:F-type H+-transporting ATPase subunit epsilon
MSLEIVTPDKQVFSGEIRLIQLPGSLGSFEILKGHAPIISTLEKGQIKVIQRDGEEIFYPVSSGVIEATDNNIIVLVESV